MSYDTGYMGLTVRVGTSDTSITVRGTGRSTEVHVSLVQRRQASVTTVWSSPSFRGATVDSVRLPIDVSTINKG